MMYYVDSHFLCVGSLSDVKQHSLSFGKLLCLVVHVILQPIHKSHADCGQGHNTTKVHFPLER